MSVNVQTFVVIDTTFAVVNMGDSVVDQLTRSRYANQLEVQRFTVPGFKDLAASARKGIDTGASIVLAAGMPGPEPIDESCAKDASFGLQMTQAMTGAPVLEIFVHMSETLNEDGSVDYTRLATLSDNRCRSHADNALMMVFAPEEMVARAGTGRRQGGDDIGSVESD